MSPVEIFPTELEQLTGQLFDRYAGACQNDADKETRSELCAQVVLASGLVALERGKDVIDWSVVYDDAMLERFVSTDASQYSTKTRSNLFRIACGITGPITKRANSDEEALQLLLNA